MLTGIREILIISTPDDLHLYQHLLGDGNHLGIDISYAMQPSPDGLAQAFIIGADFVGDDNVCLILGDNIYYGHNFEKTLTDAVQLNDGSIVFGYYVHDPERYGVVEFNDQGRAISLEEKPEKPKSNYAVTGLYFYSNDVIEKAKSLKPSARGELEITDLNRLYMEEDRLQVKIMGRGMAWLDTGTPESLLQASNYIYTVEKRQGLKISCIEEIAFKKNFINKMQLLKLAEGLRKSDYGQYLFSIANEKIFTFDNKEK
jgi:glucose-1-phosphate thymidylyltransferase